MTSNTEAKRNRLANSMMILAIFGIAAASYNIGYWTAALRSEKLISGKDLIEVGAKIYQCKKATSLSVKRF